MPTTLDRSVWKFACDGRLAGSQSDGVFVELATRKRFPTPFTNTLKWPRFKPLLTTIFFSANELNELIQQARCHQAEALVCTVKDLVKVRELDCQDFPILALSIEANFVEGEVAMQQGIQQTLGLERL